MKFIFFNIAVIGSLFFLLSEDRPDFGALSEKFRTTLSDAGQAVEKTIAEPADSQSKSEETDPAETPSKIVPTTSEPAKTIPSPSIVERREDTEPREPKVAVVSEPKLDPAVAKRRAEVLGEGPLPRPAAVADGENALMTPTERRRELFTLAEEMELFHIRRLSR